MHNYFHNPSVPFARDLSPSQSQSKNFPASALSFSLSHAKALFPFSSMIFGDAEAGFSAGTLTLLQEYLSARMRCRIFCTVEPERNGFSVLALSAKQNAAGGISPFAVSINE